tara:strand:- start:272 stop:496 length:225 start_codon:yes stop_codon:yes gene_type:complete
VEPDHPPKEPRSWILRALAAHCAGLATFDRSAELLQVRSFKGATPIAAVALQLAAITPPVIYKTGTVTAGAVHG